MDGLKLKPEEYWEWRCSIYEMEMSKKNYELADIKRVLMEKEVEVLQLKLKIFKETVKDKRENIQVTQRSYEELKKKLEERLGTSLNDSVIDEVTFEVKKL